MMCKEFRVVALKMIIYYNLCFTGETPPEIKMSETTIKNAGLNELNALGKEFYAKAFESDSRTAA